MQVENPMAAPTMSDTSELMLLSDPRVAAVRVRDNGEELVDLRAVRQFRVDSRKHTSQGAQGAYARLRRGVVERLLHAQELLPEGLQFLIVEGHRPASLQAQYFGEHREELRRAHPDWSDAHLYRATSRYVAPPDVAGHPCGAAVDLTLCTLTGEELDMGTRMNADPEESQGACFTAAPNITREASERRRVLGDALSRAGLVNYPTEWWHWSYGDRYWAAASGLAESIYGPRD